MEYNIDRGEDKMKKDKDKRPDLTVEELTSSRFENETYEKYKERRAKGNAAVEKHLKGFVSWNSNIKETYIKREANDETT